MAVALAQPHRQGKYTALAGYALGRLFLTKQLTPDQFAAGERYTRLVVRHMRHITGSLPRFPSVMADRIATETGAGKEMAEEDVMDLRRDWGDAMTALSDTGEMDKAVRLLVRVCVLDRDLGHEHELGTMRVALNSLHRMWA